MSLQKTRWCFTLNNPTNEEISALNLKASDFTYLVYGKETGDSGTPHLQGFVIFPRSVRLATAKRSISNRCHVEAARGTSKQASDYCKKDGDFEEFGTLPGEQQGKRTDWDRYRDWVESLGRLPTKREIIRYNPSLFARYSSRCLEIANAFLPPVGLTGDEQPRFGWQSRLVGRIESEPNRRSIDFVVDPAGNSGKSWICRYALSKWPDKVQVLRIGKRDDLAYSIDETKSIFLFDVPREQMQFLQYSVMESLKDQMIYSPKYESSFKILRHVPYVAVFSNEQPDMNKLTADRYHIINV